MEIKDVSEKIPVEVTRLIHIYFPPGSVAYKYYYTHCLKVTELAVKISRHHPEWNLAEDSLIRGAMLHDIGIIMTDAPEIGCHGKHPYIAHTYLGREILEKEGFEDIATICEKHIGVGLTVEDIEKNHLPLPKRNMLPETIEEKLICYADKFYSKSPKYLTNPRPLSEIRRKILKYGADKAEIFEEMVRFFGVEHIFKGDIKHKGNHPLQD